jgi:DegV family protein with EDD domain
MSRIAVVTDSTAYLPPELVAQYGIHVMPQQLIWGDETFLDGVAIDPPTFYERLSRSGDIPTTSQVPVGGFADLFAEVARSTDGIVGVFISTELSGTVASALAAQELLPDLPIEVVDSRSTTMGLGFVALAAARAAAEGKGLAEVAATARELVPRVNVLFIVETLEYLHRGGRIGGASRLLGSALYRTPPGRTQPGHRHPRRAGHRRGGVLHGGGERCVRVIVVLSWRAGPASRACCAARRA